MVSAHADGSLNLWLVTFSDSGSFTGVASITHITRSCGPRFGTTQLVAHPSLPLVIGTSQRGSSKNSNCSTDPKTLTVNNIDIESELILWNTNHVSPLSEFKGVTEMARISSPDPHKFLCISWLPEMFHFSLVSITNDGIDLLPNAPSACFIAATDNGLFLYQILLDSKTLLSNLGMLKFSASLPDHMRILSDLIESEQSGSQSACIMNVCQLDNSQNISNVQFLHVFTKQAVSKRTNNPKHYSNTTLDGDAERENEAFNRSYATVRDNDQEFYVLAVYNDDNSNISSDSVDQDRPNSNNHYHQKFAVWKLTVSPHERFASTLSPVSVEDCDFSPSSPSTSSHNGIDGLPGFPTSSPAASRKKLSINHCIDQKLIYHENISSLRTATVNSSFSEMKRQQVSTSAMSSKASWRLFSPMAGLHSSNEYCASLPVKYHFTAVSSLDNSLDFWKLVMDENNTLTIHKCDRITNKMSDSTEKVVSLSCASSSRLAYITQKEALGNRVDYSLVVKENETSGEEQWTTEYSRLFYPDVDTGYVQLLIVMMCIN